MPPDPVGHARRHQAQPPLGHSGSTIRRSIPSRRCAGAVRSGGIARRPAADRPDRSRVVPRGRDALPAPGPAGRRGAPGEHRGGQPTSSGWLRATGCRSCRGAPGTGLSGGAAGIEGGLTVALTRLDRILEIDHENLDVTVQPGVINADLKKAVAAEGLFYGPDPASYEMCSIGGNLGTNAGGLCCVKYGQTRDWVLGLEVVLADGDRDPDRRQERQGRRRLSLTQLFVGLAGHARTDHRGDAAAAARAGTPLDAARLLPDARGGRAGGRRHDGRRDAAGAPWSCSTSSRSAPWTTGITWDSTSRRRRCCSSSPTCRAPASDDRARPRGVRLRTGRHDAARPRRRRGRVRPAAAGPAPGLPGARAARHGEDGGHRGPAQPRAGDAGRHRGDLPAARASGSGRSVTQATATCTRTSCSSATTRARRRSPKRSEPSSTARRWTWAARSRPSTASGLPARLPGAAARPRVRGRHARDQDGARSAEHPEPGPGPAAGPRACRRPVGRPLRNRTFRAAAPRKLTRTPDRVDRCS